MISHQSHTEPMIYAGALRGIDALVSELANRNIRPSNCFDPDDPKPLKEAKFIPLGDYDLALSGASKNSNFDKFALIFGSRFHPFNLGPLGYAISRAKTLGDALSLFCDKFELVQDDTRITLDVQGDVAQLKYAVDSGRPLEVDAEASIGILYSICRRAIGPTWRIRQMAFAHQHFKHNDLVNEVFGINPTYGADANTLSFDRSFLDQPILIHDPYLYRLLKEDVEIKLGQKSRKANIVGKVVSLIEQEICAHRQFDLRSVSRLAGLSERALRDRMRDSGTSYRALAMKARVDQAKLLIRTTDLSLTEIALDVGLSEASALSRAFRQMGESSPMLFRKQCSDF